MVHSSCSVATGNAGSTANGNLVNAQFSTWASGASNRIGTVSFIDCRSAGPSLSQIRDFLTRTGGNPNYQVDGTSSTGNTLKAQLSSLAGVTISAVQNLGFVNNKIHFDLVGISRDNARAAAVQNKIKAYLVTVGATKVRQSGATLLPEQAVLTINNR
jgi:hypothetical protein